MALKRVKLTRPILSKKVSLITIKFFKTKAIKPYNLHNSEPSNLIDKLLLPRVF